MSYEHFGVLLHELRKSRKLTRDQLALNICTPKQIYRIEKGEYEPSLYLLNQLSIKFNMDLNEYFKMYFTNQSIVGFEGIKNINNAMERNDMKSVKSLVEKYESLKEFKQGENLQHILYGKALCAALSDQDYNLSLNYCMDGIHIENESFSLNTITKSTYSNVGLSLINCMICNYMELNDQKTVIKLLLDLLYVIENYILGAPYPMYQSTEFSKKIYQSTLYNLSFLLMKSGEESMALHYVNKGIEFSLKEYNLRFLPELLYIKFQLMYCAKNYTKAKEYYQRVSSLYEITNQEDKLKELEEILATEFPELMK